MRKKTVLLLTDFSYEAKGRQYFQEDLFLYDFLKKYFNVGISHIADAEKFLTAADLVLIRNTGPQMTHEGELAALRKRRDLILFNDLLGKGDINGKEHLKSLFDAGFPVIPTFTSKEEVQAFGNCERYLLKPMKGADSIGVKILTHTHVMAETHENVLIQPLMDFEYEVSFYFIGKQFYYALYAPDKLKRWELDIYKPSPGDIKFAKQFIEWNTCINGIQRVFNCLI